MVWISPASDLIVANAFASVSTGANAGLMTMRMI